MTATMDSPPTFKPGNTHGQGQRPKGARSRAWRFPASPDETRWRDNLRRRLVRAGLSWQYADTLAGRALTLRRIMAASDEVYARDTAEWWRCRQEFVDAERELVEIEAKAGTRPLTRTEPTAPAAPAPTAEQAAPRVSDLFDRSGS